MHLEYIIDQETLSYLNWPYDLTDDSHNIIWVCIQVTASGFWGLGRFYQVFRHEV